MQNVILVETNVSPVMNAGVMAGAYPGGVRLLLNFSTYTQP